MARRYAIARPPGHTAEMVNGARGVLADVLFLQGPRGLDGIEIGRVRRQVKHADAVPTTDRRDTPVVMRAQIVHHEYITATQAWEQLPRQPAHEALGVRGGEHRLQHDPAGVPDRAEEGQGRAPVHRHPLDVLGAALHPGMGPVHGDMHARFVEKHEAVDRHGADGPQEGPSSGLDVGAVHFLRPTPFFLTT